MMRAPDLSGVAATNRVGFFKNTLTPWGVAVRITETHMF